MTRAGQDDRAADGSDPSSQPPTQSTSRSPARRAPRWTGIAVACALACVFALGYLLFVPLADWLARHDVGTATGTTLAAARNDARGALLTFTAGAVAAGALVFTARNVVLQRRTLELAQRSFEDNARSARRTLELTEQGQVADRYTKAIDQLGSERASIRVGGIYALERIACDSARDHPTVMEVLAAFLRDHVENAQTGQSSPMLADIRAAAIVIGRRTRERDLQTPTSSFHAPTSGRYEYRTRTSSQRTCPART